MDAAATYVSEVTQTLHFAVRLSVHFEVLQITLRRKVALPSKIYKNQLPVSETLDTYLCTWYSCYINKYILKVLKLKKTGLRYLCTFYAHKIQKSFCEGVYNRKYVNDD